MTATKKKSISTIPVSFANIGAIFASSMGMPFETALQKIGINTELLLDPNARIPDLAINKLFSVLQKINPDKNTSLKLAQSIPLSMLGSTWQCMSQSKDLQTLLTLTNSYYDLISDQLDIELIDREQTMLMRMDHVLDENDGGLGAEVGIGLCSRIAREYFGDNIITQIHFRHSQNSPISEYDDFFKVPIIFNADFNALEYDCHALNTRNQKNATIEKVLIEQQLKKLRQEFIVEDSIDSLEGIRLAIIANINKGDYTALGLSRTLNMSLRNLQRRLRAYGTNTRTMIDEVRYINALTLLSDEEVNIEDVAFQLGFDSERGFRKAFKRWAEKTPGQARSELLINDSLTV